MTRHRARWPAVALFGTAAAFAVVPACSSDDGGVAPTVVVTVTLSPPSISLLVGETTTVTATVTGADGAAVTFGTSNASVATVDGGGVVTGTGAGTATITVTVVGHTATASTQVVVEEPPPPPPPNYIVRGADMGAQHQNVHITTDAFEVVSLVGTVNEESLELVNPTSGLYRVALETAVPPGDSIVLEVTIEDVIITARDAVPEQANLTGPADNSAFTAAQAIQVSWESPDDPDRFLVSASYSCGPGCGTSERFEAAGSERVLTIPAGALPTNEPIRMRVFAYMHGVFTGPVTEESAMNIRAPSVNEINITVTP